MSFNRLQQCLIRSLHQNRLNRLSAQNISTHSVNNFSKLTSPRSCCCCCCCCYGCYCCCCCCCCCFKYSFSFSLPSALQVKFSPVILHTNRDLWQANTLKKAFHFDIKDIFTFTSIVFCLFSRGLIVTSSMYIQTSLEKLLSY